MNNTIKIHNTVYFIHIPKTSGSSLTSKQIIKLGHRFNVKNIYRIPKKKKDTDVITQIFIEYMNIQKLQIQKSVL